MKRRKTRVVKIGNVKIGGDNPVAIQSMAKTDTRDVKRSVSQIKRLAKAGCEIVRVAVKGKEAALSIRAIKRKISIPLVADIHFDHKLALLSMESGADKIRINPGNMRDKEKVREVIKVAKRRKVSIRIGLNSGSLQKTGKRKEKTDAFTHTALEYIKFFEREDFRDIVISLKSSDVEETVNSYRELSAICDYPFHIGVTAAGSYSQGIVKSSIGIGALLLDGIGDTIRVSLTGDPVEEVAAAKRILQALGRRNFGPNIISCPTCGRCQVDLVALAEKLERKISGRECLKMSKPVTVAIMGCEVNGPGEARVADIGIAFGRNSGILFKKGKIIKKIKPENTVREILRFLGS